MATNDYRHRPEVQARSVELLYDDGLPFRDINKNGEIDTYEDWRQPVEVRVADLLSQMTLDEKAGMLMIDQLNADAGGQVPLLAGKLLFEEKMTRFILRNTVTNSPQETGHPFFGAQVTPYEMAQFTNAVQEMCETTRLGIPRNLQVESTQPLRRRIHGRTRCSCRGILGVAQRGWSRSDS